MEADEVVDDVDDVQDDDVKGEEEDDVENDDVEEDDTEDADAEEEDRSQDRAACFVWACAVEMHVNISEEPLYTEMFRKNAAPDPRTTLCASLRSRNALQHFTREPVFFLNFTGKMPRPRT